MSNDRNQDESNKRTEDVTSRRKALKLLGASGVGMTAVSGFAEDASASHCTEHHDVYGYGSEEYESWKGVYITNGLDIEHRETCYLDGRYTHTFRVSGSGLAHDGNEKVAAISNHGLLVSPVDGVENVKQLSTDNYPGTDPEADGHVCEELSDKTCERLQTAIDITTDAATIASTMLGVSEYAIAALDTDDSQYWDRYDHAEKDVEQHAVFEVHTGSEAEFIIASDYEGVLTRYRFTTSNHSVSAERMDD